MPDDEKKGHLTMERYIGRTLDNRYEILEVIGKGGMAYVFKARCNLLNRYVAIKILKKEFREDDPEGGEGKGKGHRGE